MNGISGRRLNRFPRTIILLLCIGSALGYANAQARRTYKPVTPAIAQTYTQTVIHQFGSVSGDAVQPMSGLIKDNAGNFYGAAYLGGPSEVGAIFEFTPSGSGGTYSTIFSELDSDTYYITGLSMDSLGNLYGTCGYYTGGVFELSKDLTGNWIESNAYDFTGIYDGGFPFPQSPVLDSAGNVYAVPSRGGTYNSGTVDELEAANGQWLENTLYTFGASGTVGSNPNSLAMDSAGDLYGTTPAESTSNGGVLFKLHNTSEGWVYSQIHGFQFGPTDGGMPRGSLTFDSAGNIYGTATWGFQPSGECCGGVYKITPSGKITWLYIFQGGADGGGPINGVVFDKNGNLYGTTQVGGGGNPDYCGSGIGGGCGVVFKLTPPPPRSSTTAWTESVLYTFTGGTDGFEPSGSLVFDNAGNIYGTTAGGGIGWGIGGKGVLYELTPDPVATTSTITKTSPDPAGVGQSVAINFSVVGLNPTGLVTIQSSTGEECVAPVQPNGTGRCALIFAAAGTKTVTAAYAGDTENLASVSAGVSLQIENVTKTTITKNVPDPAKTGQAVTLHFDVAVNDGAMRKTLPTGSVTVNASTGESCTGTLLTSGSGKCEIVFSSSGSRTLVATYPGDADNEGSVSIAVAETIN